MSELDVIMKTMMDIPDIHIHRIFVRTIFTCRDRPKVHVRVEDSPTQIHIENHNATLAEAVAALTPPSQPKPPTYEFVAGIKGAEAGDGFVLFRNLSGRLIGFTFNAEGLIKCAVFGDEELASPTTEDEVLATLKMCRVEVGEKCQ